MWNAVLYVDGVPAFYFPYYRRNLNERFNNFNFTPGDRTLRAVLLNTYTMYLNDAVTERFIWTTAKSGPGRGPDLNLHLGQWARRRSGIIICTTRTRTTA